MYARLGRTFRKCKIKRKVIPSLGGFGWTLVGFRLRTRWKGVMILFLLGLYVESKITSQGDLSRQARGRALGKATVEVREVLFPRGTEINIINI
jgi:hypothetical protein